MNLAGKGYFIWKVRDTENGDPNAIAALAQQSAYTHVLVKVADGIYSYNVDSSGVDLARPVVQALHARAIQAWGWHYIYGDSPTSEADKAIQRIQQLGLDGYVLDVEQEYKEPGKSAAARTFMNRLRSAYPALPVALCSYRYPTLHPQVPWTAFLEQCDLNMPQVYWEQAHNPDQQLTRSVQEFQAITPLRPIFPVGAAYKVGSWAATPADVTLFMQTAQTLNLAGVNFWEWAHTRLNLPAVWTTIQNYAWTPPSNLDISIQLVNALNTKNPDLVTPLYTPTGIHVNSARTVQGSALVRAWYQSLFIQVLPNAVFTHTGFSGTGSARYFTWTATSSAGNVLDGSDTLGLINNKIAYHFTHFTITPARR